MDAYSICCTNSAGRSTSKIYQDLKAIRNHSLPEFDPGYMLKQITRMEASKQVQYLVLLLVISFRIIFYFPSMFNPSAPFASLDGHATISQA